MAKFKIVKTNKKIAENVIKGYNGVEKGVVGSYKKVENGVVGGFAKIINYFVDGFLSKDGESVEEAKKRLADGRADLEAKNKARMKESFKRSKNLIK